MYHLFSLSYYIDDNQFVFKCLNLAVDSIFFHHTSIIISSLFRGYSIITIFTIIMLHFHCSFLSIYHYFNNIFLPLLFCFYSVFISLLFHYSSVLTRLLPPIISLISHHDFIILSISMGSKSCRGWMVEASRSHEPAVSP